MPYTVDSPPERLKGKGIPDKFIRMFVHVFNSVYDRTKDEGKAWKAGYKVMGEALRKAGYTRDEDGKWHKEEAELEQEMDVLYESRTPVTILEEVEIEGETEKGLKYEGCALIDNVLSENDRFYSRDFNDRCMEATNAFMEGGGIVTVFGRHGRALGSFGSLPTGYPVGKVAAPLFRAGNEIHYHGLIVPTQEGKDMMTLLRTAVMPWNSIRANQWESVPRELEGKEVQDMVSAVLAGIDFTDNPGIKGAGVRQIFEEAPEWEEEQQEDEDMELEKATLEELLEHCKPLLDEYAATAVGEAEAKAAALEEQVGQLTEGKEKADEAFAAIEALTAERDAALAEKDKSQKAVEEASGKLAALELKLKVAEAVHIGTIAKSIYEELSEKVEKEEDIAENLPEVRERAMALALARTGSGKVKGQASFEDDEAEEPTLTEGQEKVLRLAH